MKLVIVSVLVASAMTLGACAHAGGENAALSGAEMKAELAAVTQQVDEVSQQLDTLRAASKEERAGVNSAYALARLERLMGRQEELRWTLAHSSDPSAALDADEIRERIARIDKDLTRQGLRQGPAPASRESGVFRPGMRYISANISGYVPTPDFAAARMPIMSTGGRSFAWRYTYRLKQEREDLYARLQTLESSQD